MREQYLAEDELIMLRGLKAREEQLQELSRQLASDHAYVLGNIAIRLQLPEKDIGDRYQISTRYGVLIDTHEAPDGTHAQPADHGP